MKATSFKMKNTDANATVAATVADHVAAPAPVAAAVRGTRANQANVATAVRGTAPAAVRGTAPAAVRGTAPAAVRGTANAANAANAATEVAETEHVGLADMIPAKVAKAKTPKARFALEGFTTKTAYLAAKLEAIKKQIADATAAKGGTEVIATIPYGYDMEHDLNGKRMEYNTSSVRIIRTPSNGVMLEMVEHTPCKTKLATSQRRIGAIPLDSHETLLAVANAIVSLANSEEAACLDYAAAAPAADAAAAAERLKDLKEKMAQERHRLESRWIAAKAQHSAK